MWQVTLKTQDLMEQAQFRLGETMLIEAPYKVGDTVSIKLSSGEEMVCRLEEENDTHVVVKQPMMLVAGKNGAGLAPFMFTVTIWRVK